MDRSYEGGKIIMGLKILKTLTKEQLIEKVRKLELKIKTLEYLKNYKTKEVQNGVTNN